MSERLEQPREQKKKRLTPAEIYRVAADIYESLPEGYKGLIISALVGLWNTEKDMRPLTSKEGF